MAEIHEQEGIPQPAWNRRKDLRTTDETLQQVPQLVLGEHQKQAEDLRMIFRFSLGELRMYMQDPNNTDRLTNAMTGFMGALALIKNWSDDELINLYSQPDPSRKQGGPRVLGTILGDMITAFGIYHERLERDPQDQTAQKEMIEKALAEIVGLLETAQREETIKLMEAKGPVNKREEVRMVKVPLVFWQIMGLDHEVNGKSFHSLWESIVLHTQEFKAQTQYLNRLEEEESYLKATGDSAKYAQGSARATVTARRFSITNEIKGARETYKKTRDNLMLDMRLFVEEFEKLSPKKLQQLKQTGLLGGIIGDIITIASSLQNDLKKPDRKDREKDKYVTLTLAKAMKVLRLATFSSSGRVMEIDTVVEQTARNILGGINPDHPHIGRPTG